MRQNVHIQDRKYYLIVIAIYISVFINSIVLFKQPFEFYLGYLIYLLLLPVFFLRYRLNVQLTTLFGVLLITGIVNISLQNNTPALFFKVITGLFLSYFFYYYVILEFKYDVEKLFGWYLKGAYIVALIGLFQFISFQFGFEPGYNFRWIFNKWGFVPGGNFGIRVNSVFGEPTYLATTLSASFFVSVYNLIRKELYYYSRWQSIVIIVVYFLSFSGVGQSGIFIALVLLSLNFGLIRYVIVLVPAAVFLFNVFYTNVAEFRDRYDSTVGLFGGTEEFKIGTTHGSSFILYNNYLVTMKSFKNNFLFGTGIGSHPVAFAKFSLAKDFRIAGFNSNAADANSMLLRLISETGLFGLCLFLFIIFKCYVARDALADDHHWLISNAILVMLLLNLLRQGHYFLNGFPFFVLLYIYNYLSFKGLLPKSVKDEQTAVTKDTE